MTERVRRLRGWVRLHLLDRCDYGPYGCPRRPTWTWTFYAAYRFCDECRETFLAATDGAAFGTWERRR